jgi:hypothetical protein
MPRPATVRRVPLAPTDVDFFIRLATDAIMGVMTELRLRVERAGTSRSVAQVLLAEAHIDEAIGLLKAIQPMPSMREFTSARPVLSPAPPAPSRVLRVRRPHQHGRAS